MINNTITELNIYEEEPYDFIYFIVFFINTFLKILFIIEFCC